MAVYLVTYDFNKERSDSDRAKLREKIKSYGLWARLSESSYAIESSDDANTIFESLRTSMDSNDDLFVITLTRGWWGKSSQEVLDWLLSRL